MCKACIVRRFTCRWPGWRYADQVHIKDTRCKAPSVSLVYLVPICSIIRPSCSDLLTPPLVRSLPSGSDRTSIILILCQHGPNGSGHLVCQRNRSDEARLSSQHRLQPRPKRTRPTYCPPDYCHRSRNQQASDIPLTHLRCPPEPRPPSGRMLAWNQPQPRSEITPPPKGRHFRRKGFDG